jgi:hypothetical protein
MQKLFFAGILLLVLNVCIYSQNKNIKSGFGGDFNSYVGDTKHPVSYGGFTFFHGGNYEFYFGVKDGRERGEIPDIYFSNSTGSSRYIEEGEYFTNKEGVYDYLYLKSNTDFTYKQKLGIIFHPRRLFLYDGNEIFFASDEGPRWAGHNPEITDIKMSSFLKEGSVSYDAQNFKRPSQYYLRPWVEGAAGDGVGEWIELTLERYDGMWPLDYFIISNGYVSFNNPSLYERNNRIKKLRIICETEGINIVVGLEDTPHFQEIFLPRQITSETSVFKFMIEDVYSGTQWDDTCLNLIIPLGNRP